MNKENETVGTLRHFFEQHGAAGSETLLIEFVSFFGGMQIYIPQAKNLLKVQRDEAIYRAFNGTNIEEIAREHHLSFAYVYEIIRKVRMTKQAEKIIK